MPALLCTSCEGRRCFVESGGKPFRRSAKGALVGLIRAEGLRNRLPARIFTVYIRIRGSTIRAVRFPNPVRASFFLPVQAGHERDLRGATMNKADLVDKIAGACEMSKAQATTAIDTAVESITSALRKGDRVALIGFGTFSVSARKARNGRNPQTGATIKIAARKVAKFTPGAELKKAVNKK